MGWPRLPRQRGNKAPAFKSNVILLRSCGVMVTCGFLVPALGVRFSPRPNFFIFRFAFFFSATFSNGVLFRLVNRSIFRVDWLLRSHSLAARRSLFGALFIRFAVHPQPSRPLSLHSLSFLSVLSSLDPALKLSLSTLFRV